MNKLKQMIKDSNISQRELSKITGIQLTTINRWFTSQETPKNPMLAILVAISPTSDDLIKNISAIIEENDKKRN